MVDISGQLTVLSRVILRGPNINRLTPENEFFPYFNLLMRIITNRFKNRFFMISLLRNPLRVREFNWITKNSIARLMAGIYRRLFSRIALQNVVHQRRISSSRNLESRDLEGVLRSFDSPIRFCMAYGSGVRAQQKSPDERVDMIRSIPYIR